MVSISEKSSSEAKPHESDARFASKLEESNEYAAAALKRTNMKPTSRLLKIADDWWLIEFVAELVALTGLFATFGLLWHYDNKPVPRFADGYWTLNSIVALLATITKGALMVSVASALGRRKWRHFLPRSTSWKRRSEKASKQLLGDFETFDSASRGAFGSVQLMWKLRLR